MPVSGRVGNEVRVKSVSDSMKVRRSVWNVAWTPMINGAQRRVWNAVDVCGGMWNRVIVVPMPNQVRVCRRMWNVMKMRIGNKSLCICKLSHSKNCNRGQYECACLQHFNLPERCLILLTSCRRAVHWLPDPEQLKERFRILRANSLKNL